jgi:N-methylhydantoinase B
MTEVLRFETIRTNLQMITDEVAVRLAQSSLSPVIRDYLDFSTALCDLQGRVVVQGFSLPLHLGAIPRAMEGVLAAFPRGLDPGDLAILNDPYAGGMHLPDIFVVAPAHFEEKLVGYSVLVAHHADIGGRVPGGSAADSREVFEEGLRLPPVLLVESGHRNRALEAIIRANVRLPDILGHDLRAQEAGCRAGATSLVRLIAQHGRSAYEAAVKEMFDHGRRGLVETIRRWPQGTYRFQDIEDHDGISDSSVAIRVAVVVGAERVRLDFTGTSPQVRGSINSTLSFTESAAYAAIRSLCDDDIPVNAGFTSGIDVVAPTGTVVNVQFPGGVAARGVIGYRIIECIYGALAAALPDCVPAAGDGGTSGVRLGGFDTAGERFQCNDLVCGTWGAHPDHDGLEGAAGMAANVSNRPVEILERDDPVRVVEYGFVDNTGGPGRYRGGLAIRRSLQLLAPEAVLNLRTHRNRTPPYGLAGGHPGTTSKTYLIRDDQRRLLPAKTTVEMRQGDVVEHTTASGGGIGDPRERSRVDVVADVREGKVSRASARAVYGLSKEDYR